MHSCYHLATILLLLTATVVGTTHAFNISSQLLSHHRPATALFGGKRRGRLTNNVSLDEDGNVARIMTKREKQKLGSSKMKKKNNASSSVTISPLLAEWAKDDDNSSSASSKESTTATTVSTATTFTPFDDDNETTDKKKRKANKRAQRAALTAVQTQQIDTLLEQINDMLQTTNLDRVELVSLIKSLVTIGSSSSSSNNNDQVLLPTLKSIVSTRPSTKDGETKKLPSYRLAWVGSDTAICHIGTSLHKVPLARLQEVFVTLGYNRWELYEVIRIIGPFPNVRNTLKGDVKLRKLSSSSYENEREGVRMEISYMSMIDGTGKEILAGKEDNIKYVNLDVWFANEKVIVCTVPSEENDNGDGGDGEDPFTGDGSNVLFFVGEENLDEQLEKLRAA
jgi:hypothetical protein